MQRYRHYGSSSASSAPVEEIHAEEEEEVFTEEEEAEPLIQEEAEPVVQTGRTGEGATFDLVWFGLRFLFSLVWLG